MRESDFFPARIGQFQQFVAKDLRSRWTWLEKPRPELKLRHNLSSDKSVGSTPEIFLYYVAEESNMSEISSFDKTSATNGTATVRALDKSFGPSSSQQKLREARIVGLREQYESGKYLVDAARVSAAIVGQHINVLA